MHSLWNSVEFVSRLNLIVQITGAIVGVLIVVLGYHLSSLENAQHRPRHITKKAKAAFMDYLKNAPRGPVIVRTNAFDNEETFRFCDEIRTLLNEAGYSAQGDDGKLVVEAMSRAPSNAATVWLMVNTEEDAPPYAGQIQSAFKKAGIDVHGYLAKGEVTWVPEGSAVIFVVPRP